ncbi:MAG: hypothetical protein ACRDSH_18275 [Pseudonocardiaceae bacterium]
MFSADQSRRMGVNLEEYESFRHHAKNWTLRIHSHEFHAGHKQLLIYGVRRSGHGTEGRAEAEVHIHLAHIGNGIITGSNIRWVGDRPSDALELGYQNSIIDVCTRSYFPDEARRSMGK